MRALRISRPSATEWRAARLLLAGMAVVYAVVTLVALPAAGSGAPVTAYSMTSAGASSLDLVAGLGLITAGFFVWSERSGDRLAPLAILAGLAWFGPDWVGWVEGAPVVRSLGMVMAPFAFGLLFHLVLAFPTGKLGSISRVATVALYSVAAIVNIGRALFYDPFLDPDCFSGCTGNVFLVHPDPALARTLDDIWIRTALAAAVMLAVICAWRLARATRPALRRLWPVLVPGTLVAGAEAAYALTLLGSRLERPSDPTFAAIFVARSAATIALALGLVWSLLASRRIRRGLSRLAAQLAEIPAPGSLRATLAEAVGDPSLEVGYWLPDTDRYVDAEGRPVEPPGPSSGRARTPVVRGGRPVALLTHDAGKLDPDEFEREIGPAGRLAIENQRLEAEVMAQLRDLRDSRARIVETADEARRQLERNLHDGVQQRLLALIYDLRLARAAADVEVGGHLGPALDDALEQAHEALFELRELAQGIYPYILADGGLDPAVRSLAEEAAIAVEIGEVTKERFPPSIETTAYLVVAEAAAEAPHDGGDGVVVSIVENGGELVVWIAGATATPSAYLGDRVAAVGGSIALEATGVRARIPCA